MSRIGKQPVKLPAGVTVTVGSDNVVTVKGPKGELKESIDRDITVTVNDGQVTFTRPTDQIRHRAMHGLYRALIANLVKGVTEGFKKELELVGVGYKAANTGNLLDLALGYSHNIIFEVPKELKVTTVTEKGQNPKITILLLQPDYQLAFFTPGILPFSAISRKITLERPKYLM